MGLSGEVKGVGSKILYYDSCYELEPYWILAYTWIFVLLGISKWDFERVWKRRPEKLMEIGKRKKCGHYSRERNFGERAKVIKEDFEEELSAKDILAMLLELKMFLLSVILRGASRWKKSWSRIGLATQGD